MLSPDSRFIHNDREVAAQVIGGEAILINLSSGIYYSIEKAGGAAWSLIAAQYSIAEAAEAIAARYSVDQAQAQADLVTLAEALIAEGIIEAATGAAASTPVESLDEMPPAGQALPYVAPFLNTYRDMGDLLALDPPMPGIDELPWQPSGR